MDFFDFIGIINMGVDNMNDATMQQCFCEINLKKDMGMHYCGKRINTQNHIYGPEIRNHYLFVLVDKGTAVMCGDSKLRFGQHDLLVMCPNTKIHYKALEEWSITWLGLSGDAIKEYMDILGVTPQAPILHISLYNELSSVMERIYNASNNTELASKLRLSGLIYEFFSVLLENSTVSPKTNFVESALNIINYNFCEDISIERIAEHLSVDPAYFSRKFTEAMGVSPKKYILHKRIERAKELLNNSDAGIFEISNSVGYDDQFYFCRIFKKITHLSPSEYRKSKSR